MYNLIITFGLVGFISNLKATIYFQKFQCKFLNHNRVDIYFHNEINFILHVKCIIIIIWL